MGDVAHGNKRLSKHTLSLPAGNVRHQNSYKFVVSAHVSKQQRHSSEGKRRKGRISSARTYEENVCDTCFAEMVGGLLCSLPPWQFSSPGWAPLWSLA